MPPATPPPVDVVTVAIALLAGAIGAPAAQLVGPYAVIVLAAVLGAAWSASRSAPRTRCGVVLSMARVVGLALLVAVPLAELLALHVGLERRWLLGPVAAIVGGVGEDWPAVIRWAMNQARSVIERRASKEGDSGK